MGKDELSLMLFCVLTGLIIIYINYRDIFLTNEAQKRFGQTAVDLPVRQPLEIDRYIPPMTQQDRVHYPQVSTPAREHQIKIYEISTIDFLNILRDDYDVDDSLKDSETNNISRDSRRETTRDGQREVSRDGRNITNETNRDERTDTRREGTVSGQTTHPPSSVPTRRVFVTEKNPVARENMVLIPAGEAIYNNITVSVPAFYIDKHEVTIAEYKKFDRTYVPPPNFNSPDMPATNVSFTMAERYARSRGKRLPTEVEWIRAARGNTNYDYDFGDVFNVRQGRIGLSWEAGPAAVGSYKPNQFGVFDMTGNVWEWVNTNFINPKAPGERSYFVLKGGSWYYSQENSKIDNIRVERFDFRSIDIGFRCVADL